jgi:hypothetical protein
MTKYANYKYCETCDYKCDKMSSWKQHLLTNKHIMATSGNQNMQLKISNLECCCGKKYKDRTGLWRHTKKCVQYLETVDTGPSATVYENTVVTTHSIDHNLLFELIKQNQEFKELLVEQNKTMIDLAGKVGNTNMTTNNNNINNIKNQNNFNIQMFLNEKCKDAISLDDFVESLQINAETAEYAGKHGYVNGITNIFMTGLKQLEVHMRPIHCTDLKRETMYVKGINMWAKDGENNSNMMGAIKDVSTKNMKQLPVWIEENPDSKISGTEKYEEQLRIMMGMLDLDKNKEKVLKNLAKEVLIDKQNN